MDDFIAKTKRKQKPKDNDEVLVPEVVDDPVERLKQLRPVDGMNFDNFVKDLASNMQDVNKYSGVISGWFGRMKMNRQMKNVSLMQTYLMRLREASNDAAELQATLLKNKIIFEFQAQIAIQRVKEEWAVEQGGRKLQLAMLEADIAHKKFLQRFYETADPNQLSETALMLLNMLQPMSGRTNEFVQTQSGAISSTKEIKYGSIEEMYRISKGQNYTEQQNKLMEVLMQNLIAGVNEKEAKVKKTLAEADMSESEADQKKWRFGKEKEWAK